MNKIDKTRLLNFFLQQFINYDTKPDKNKVSFIVLNLATVAR